MARQLLVDYLPFEITANAVNESIAKKHNLFFDSRKSSILDLFWIIFRLFFHDLPLGSCIDRNLHIAIEKCVTGYLVRR